MASGPFGHLVVVVAQTAVTTLITPAGDTGAGADTQSIAVTFTQTGTGAGVDGQTVITGLGAMVNQADTGSGGTGTQTVAASFTQPDTGSGADSQSITVTRTQTDTGSGASGQTVTVIGTSVSSADTGSGTSNQTVIVSKTGADTGVGSSTQTVTASLSLETIPAGWSFLMLLGGTTGLPNPPTGPLPPVPMPPVVLPPPVKYTVVVKPAPKCGQWLVSFIEASTGRSRIVVPVDATSGTARRELSRSSTASVEIDKQLAGETCCALLSDIEAAAWAWEIRLDRHTPGGGVRDSQEPAWIGPVIGAFEQPRAGTIQVTAQDRSASWSGLPIFQTIDTTAYPVDATIYAGAVLRQANQLANAALGVGILSAPAGDIGRLALASEYPMVADEMAALTQFMDWAVVGRVCWLMGHGIDGNPTILQGDMWENGGPGIEVRGGDYGSHVVIVASNNIVGLYPPGPVTVPTDQFAPLGIRILKYSASSITSQYDANVLARKVWNAVHRLPVYAVTGQAGSLSDQFPGDPDVDLIPGRAWIIAPTEGCFDARSVQRLSSVEFAWTKGLETGVTVDMLPDDPNTIIGGYVNIIPDPPTIKFLTAILDAVVLTWTGPPSVHAYDIEVSTTGYVFTPVTTVTNDDLTLTYPTMVPVMMRVRSVAAGGASDWVYSELVDPVHDLTGPGPVINVTWRPEGFYGRMVVHGVLPSDPDVRKLQIKVTGFTSLPSPAFSITEDTVVPGAVFEYAWQGAQGDRPAIEIVTFDSLGNPSEGQTFDYVEILPEAFYIDPNDVAIFNWSQFIATGQTFRTDEGFDGDKLVTGTSDGYPNIAFIYYNDEIVDCVTHTGRTVTQVTFETWRLAPPDPPETPPLNYGADAAIPIRVWYHDGRVQTEFPVIYDDGDNVVSTGMIRNGWSSTQVTLPPTWLTHFVDGTARGIALDWLDYTSTDPNNPGSFFVRLADINDGGGDPFRVSGRVIVRSLG